MAGYILFKYLITHRDEITVQLMTDWIPGEQQADVWMFAESYFKLPFIYK